ncbi:MAG: serine--tRNA ligase [Chloroflexi bacterium]|nr:serine--tRNA ligase [Chloroflexota bacterium]
MLDIRLIREKPDLIRDALAKRGEAADPIDRILELDKQRRTLLTQADELRAEQNRISKEVGKLLAAKGPHAPGAPSPEALKEQSRAVGERIKELEQQGQAIDTQLNDMLLRLPNLPHESVPVGPDASANVVVRAWGEQRRFDFTPAPHWELGERHRIIDFERGQRISGSRFYLLRGKGAKLQRSLIQWMLDLHVQEHGYSEVYPPFVVKEQALYGSGNLPKFGENLYRDIEEDLWLVPTAEVPLTSMHRDDILEPGALPLSYVAYTACFRREKMSAGKDIRGIKRGHQFDKVEMYKFVEPKTSFDELERLLNDATAVCERLGLPYRVVQLCTGDLSFPSAKSYDIELWVPGVNEWLEVSSCSNCTDFQARRANIRYRPAPKAKPEYVHTLNGSGLALPRLMIALLENGQQADGSILIPEALRPYTGFDRIP